MSQLRFDAVLDAIDQLPTDEQEDLVDVVKQRLAERGRQRVIAEVNEAEKQLADGEGKTNRRC